MRGPVGGAAELVGLLEVSLGVCQGGEECGPTPEDRLGCVTDQLKAIRDFIIWGIDNFDRSEMTFYEYFRCRSVVPPRRGGQFESHRWRRDLIQGNVFSDRLLSARPAS
jgi:hypothetical protein